MKKHSSVSGVGSVDDLLEFVPSGERKTFLEELRGNISKNDSVLKQIDSSCSKINQIEGDGGKVGSAACHYSFIPWGIK